MRLSLPALFTKKGILLTLISGFTYGLLFHGAPPSALAQTEWNNAPAPVLAFSSPQRLLFENLPEPVLPGPESLRKATCSTCFQTAGLTNSLIVTSTLPISETIGPSTAYLPVVRRLHPPPPPPQRYLYCDSFENPISIPDDEHDGIDDRISLTGNGYIYDLDVYVNISHSWIGDLLVTLTHVESGVTSVLIDRPGISTFGGGCDGNNVIAILDDQVGRPVEERAAEVACSWRFPAISGSYQPQESLEKFRGEPLRGRWILNVADLNTNDNGKLNSWCLDVTVGSVRPEPDPFPPADLPDSVEITGVYGQNQSLELDCESRSAVDWANYFGTYIDEMDFFHNLPVSDNPDAGFVGNVRGDWGQIPPNPYGVHAEPVAALLRGYGVDAYAHRYLTWDRLRAELAAGRPAIVWVIGSGNAIVPGAYYPFYYHASDGHTTVVSPYQHTVIITGYTKDSAIILDGGTIHYRPLSQFLDSWGVLRNMAIFSSKE